MAAYMRIEPKHGVIEIGNIYYSPRLAQTRAATEAMYLFMANVFELGYRRFEWKCDSCNLPSRAAATRYGFTYEGEFRQAIVVKGRNRDTSWFSVIDRDWRAGCGTPIYAGWIRPTSTHGEPEAETVRTYRALRAREVLNRTSESAQEFQQPRRPASLPPVPRVAGGLRVRPAAVV